MISAEQAERLREELLRVLAEDAHNAQRLTARLEALTQESGVEAHSALLLILTRLAFDEQTAKSHWADVVRHRERLNASLGREVGLRVALVDFFVNVNRTVIHPTLIDLELEAASGADPGTDVLTGLANDRKFRTALQTELRRARRYEQRAAVVVADIDRFAEINRAFGEFVGDRLLRETAMIVNNNIRDIDLAGRPGEDEVALLLPETGRNAALLVAERFRREVERFFAGRESGNRPVNLTVSVGVACYPDDATSPEALLEHAAQALYHAKAAGRNVVHAYQPERRRYLRFELEPGRFEVEVLGPPDRTTGRARNLSRNGILFASPEILDVGEPIELRLIDPEPGSRGLRVRGRVVRLEELPAAAAGDGDAYEIGVALDLDWGEGTDDLLEFLERAMAHGSGERS